MLPVVGALIGSWIVLFFASMPAVGIVRRWLEKRRLFDMPNERSSHTTPVPRGGGLAIAALAGAAMIVAGFLAPSSTERFKTLAMAGGALIIAAVGAIDDRSSLSAPARLCMQIAVAVAVIAALGLPSLMMIAAILWVVGLTNAYNFMDGIDGIAGMQGVVAGMAWSILGVLEGDVFMSVAGIAASATCCGFLRYNWPPARIFMGDVGSGFLGFLFGALTVRAFQIRPILALSGALFVWPFLFDSAITFLRRFAARENVFTAHRSHFYQRLIKAGASHRQVTLAYALLAAICAFAGLLLVADVRWTIVAAVCACGSGIYLVTRVYSAERRMSAA